jgi:hypothetical protein
MAAVVTDDYTHRSANFLLLDNRARFIQHAVPARPIPQIQPNRQFLFEEILALLRRYGANLLHCRSPFYLCLEHVDNLGAYTASRPGDRPSHPICFR